MKFWKRGLLTALSASVVLAFGALTAPAQDAGNAGPATYENALKGKRVVLVPMTMGFDLAQGWNHFIGEEVKALAASGKRVIRTGAWMQVHRRSPI
ncbi:hypothetical protein [Brucella pituitosa]|uniref:hypothetical protein n=1 Tax=Brucella pituitosa TaxID=571256 RepID=UPI002092BDC7|nr:hypothetical protein [Brucella pituitosa]